VFWLGNSVILTPTSVPSQPKKEIRRTKEYDKGIPRT
jgi:hypothetical protein